MSAFAADTTPKTFDVPAGAAAETLKRAAQQAGLEIMFPAETVQDFRTAAIKGEYAPLDAINQMLAGSDLVASQDEQTGALTVKRVEPVATAPTATAPVPVATVPTDRPAEDETVVLNVFEVTADKDRSYGALDSNSLAAFRIELAKSPTTNEVFTQAFMDDIGAESIEEVLTGYSGTVTAASNNANAGLTNPGDREGSSGLSIRGVAAGEIKRDGFIGVPTSSRTASGATSRFSIERVETISGPQSILYGSVGGGGVVNTTSKRATFNSQKARAQFRLDSYGSKSLMLDYNYGREKVAARVALAIGDNVTQRANLGGVFNGIYAQIAYRPIRSTTIRFSTEKSSYDARVAHSPAINNFLQLGDPRRGSSAGFLAITNQVNDIKIYDEPTDYENISSAGSWWASERIGTHWNQLAIETKLGYGFSAQLIGIYSETLDVRVTEALTLLPGQGSTFANGVANPNAAGNPYDVTAMRIGSPVRINEQRDRNKGVRLSFVHEGNFDFWKLKGKSQTAFGGQAFHRGPAFGSSGTHMGYFRADDAGNVLYNHGTTAVPIWRTDANLNANNYGRNPLTFMYFPVQGGVPSKPLFRPGSDRVVYNGETYVLAPFVYADPTFVTPNNPFGLRPNNSPTAGTFIGGRNWNRGGETHSGNVYVANFTDWFDGRLTTLFGYSVTRFETMNVGAGFGNISVTPKTSLPGWQAGLNYRILPSLRAYVIFGTAEQAEASTADILGRPLKNPKAENLAPEVGLKANWLDGRLTAQFAFNPETSTLNENNNAGTAYRDAINPAGINGRVGGTSANQRVNLDRTLSSQELTISANPTRNWTVRAKVVHMDGKISKDVIYTQNYNDQFHTNGGIVTYADGTPLMVNGAGNIEAPPDTVLTLAMINNPASLYYANPNVTSGSIGNATLQDALEAIDPVRGSAATGVVGLPISAIQYNFTSPYGSSGIVPIYLAGEKNVGFNEFTFNFQNKYEFTSGFAKGVSVFVDVQTYMKNRAFYTPHPDSSGSTNSVAVQRLLYRYPSVTLFNAGISYRRKGIPWISDKIGWSTQLNVRNALNHYKVWVLPHFSNASVLTARYSAQPRTFVWTNTIDF